MLQKLAIVRLQCTYVNSADTPYIPSPKGRGFTTHLINPTIPLPHILMAPFAIDIYTFIRFASGFDLVFVLPYRLFDHFLIAGQGCEGGELCGSFFQRHARAASWLWPRQVDDVAVLLDLAFYFPHALCPPISPLRAMVRASSLRFAALRMAFFPNLFLMAIMVCCRDFSFASA